MGDTRGKNRRPASSKDRNYSTTRFRNRVLVPWWWRETKKLLSTSWSCPSPAVHSYTRITACLSYQAGQHIIITVLLPWHLTWVVSMTWITTLPHKALVQLTRGGNKPSHSNKTSWRLDPQGISPKTLLHCFAVGIIWQSEITMAYVQRTCMQIP